MAAMTEAEVEEYRKKREITVEGRDIPKPVKSFRDVGFPGKFSSLYRRELSCMFCLFCNKSFLVSLL